jgi:hypothetical protein
LGRDFCRGDEVDFCANTDVVGVVFTIEASEFQIAQQLVCNALFAAAPTLKLAGPAKTHLPIIIGQGANRKRQPGAIECHFLRRLEFECQIPFRFREL